MFLNLLTVSVGVLVQVACGRTVARPRPAHALQPREVGLLLTCVDMYIIDIIYYLQMCRYRVSTDLPLLPPA